MIPIRTPHFGALCSQLAGILTNSNAHDVGEWHAQKLPVKFLETYNVMFELEVPEVELDLASMMQPNLPWAEDHFQERVSGIPMNPPPSAAWWPFAKNGHEAHTEGGLFSHTYPERYWPKHAGHDVGNCESKSIHPSMSDLPCLYPDRFGIRYRYGDLEDVVKLLVRSPMTRQAYLPVWFPEDTGAVQNQRVPCSMGYHFWMRNDRLNCTYTLRSCDFYRHFRDDMYMSARLLQWVCARINDHKAVNELAGQIYQTVMTGHMNVHIFNLHALWDELPRLVQDANDFSVTYAEDGHVETDA